MIAFTCPKCQTKLQCNDVEAGSKVLCPACSQKLFIPIPSWLSEKTLIGELELPQENRTLAGDLLPVAVLPKAPVPKAGPGAPTAPREPASVRCTCLQCQTRIKVPAKVAGKRVKCPRCRSVVSVPAINVEEASDGRLSGSAKESWDLAIDEAVERRTDPNSPPGKRGHLVPTSRSSTTVGAIEGICSNCLTELEVAERLRGSSSPCPNCGRLIDILPTGTPLEHTGRGRDETAVDPDFLSSNEQVDPRMFCAKCKCLVIPVHPGWQSHLVYFAIGGILATLLPPLVLVVVFGWIFLKASKLCPTCRTWLNG